MRCAPFTPTLRFPLLLLTLAGAACSSKEVLWPGADLGAGAGSSSTVGGGPPATGGASTTSETPPTCARTLPASSPSLAASEIEPAIQRGLVPWRLQTPTGSCAGCHGPDAIDLARIGYADGTIRARAQSQGLDDAGAQAILDMVHALRSKFEIKLLCQPDASLFQPGGQLLSGRSNEDRDLALLDELRRSAIDLSQPLQSASAATTLVARLKSVDPLTLAVGFAMPRWSAEPTSSSEPRTQFQWLPDRAQEPTPGQEATWYGLADAYLANPSDAALWAMHEQIGTLTNPFPAPRDAEQDFGAFQTVKFQAVLVGSHLLRQAVLKYPDRTAGLPVEDNSTIRYTRSPLWDLANFSSSYNSAHALSGTPPDVTAKYGYQTDDDVGTDVSRFVAPSGWLAVGFDPARQFSGERGNGSTGLIDNGFLRSIPGAPELVLHRRLLEILLELFRIERQDERYGSMAHKPPLPNGQWATADITPAPPDDKPPDASDYTQTQLVAYRQVNLIWFRAVLEMVRQDLDARRVYSESTLQAVGSLRDYLVKYGAHDDVMGLDAAYGSVVQLAAVSTAQ